MPLHRVRGQPSDALAGHGRARRGRSFCGQFILALAILAGPLAADAQQPKTVPRIGYLSPVSKTSPTYIVFRKTLREMDYVEGRNVAFEERFADGKLDRLPAFAAELVRLRVDVIVALSAPAIGAAKAATTTIPIVMSFSTDDPVRSGFVASLARPGGNVTGLTILAFDLDAKRLELLRETVPKVSRVAVLFNPARPDWADQSRQAEAAARSLGVQLVPVKANGPDQYDSAFSTAITKRAGALLVLQDPIFTRDRGRLVEFEARHRLPSIHAWREFAEAGGLMAYGPNIGELARRAATYVDKILKGVKPADLPVEQPTKFDLVVNLKTAKTLGLTIPPSILVQATEVIH